VLSKQVFVIQSSSPDYSDARELVIQAVLEARAAPVTLTDLAPVGQSVIEILYKAIESADAIICDVSKADPNIMYELGFAHALRRPVIVISNTVSDVPFDVHEIHFLRYDTFSISGSNEFVHELAKTVSQALEDPDTFSRRPRASLSKSGVFISYSHKDLDFLRRLMIHLRPLERLGLIDLWADTKLMAGDKWKLQLELALDRARIAILLISADFLASDFITENELPPLLERAETKGTRVIPVILKPCRFSRDQNLSKFQAINDPRIPIARMSEAEQELVYDSLAEVVEQSLAK
jgi:hypothetical protein